MVELRLGGRQWTLVDGTIPDFNSVMPRDELVVAYSQSGRHALTPSSARKNLNPSPISLREGFINRGYIVHGVIKHWILKDYPNLPVGTCLFLLHDSHFFAEWRAWTE